MSKTTNIEDLIKSNIPSEYFNPKFSRNWENCNEAECYTRCGQPYYAPVGFQSIGIRVKDFDENTIIAYHGVRIESLPSIIMNGFRLPSEIEGVRKGHIPLNNTVFGIDNYADAIFVTPSIKYASLFGVQSENVLGNSNIKLIVVLQVRIKPNSYQVLPNSTLYNINDPHFNDQQIDWRVTDPKNVIPYRILYKTVTNNDFMNLYSHKSIASS